ncbi:MAG: ketopantoate reductase family protein [Oleiphilus sp.]
MASVYILGAGAMGCLWASHLHLAFSQSAQHSVQFLSTRKQPPSTINISLDSPFLSEQSKTSSRLKLSLACFPAASLLTASSNSPNIILVCTKSYDALTACLALKPFLNEQCYLVLFQNGLGSQNKIVECFANTAIFAAVSTEGVNRQADGTLVHAGKGLTRIGPLNEAAKRGSCYQQCLAALSQAGLTTERVDHIWQALWEKLAINCAINPFTAILDCPNGEITNSTLFKENWPALNVELTQMLNAAGVEIDRHQLEQKVYSVIHNTKTNISSMLQDIRASRKTEIDDMNGFAAEYLETKNSANIVNRYLRDKVSQLI